MSKRLLIIAAALYAAIAVLTFGHAAAASQARKDSAPCSTAQQRIEHWEYCSGLPASDGFGAALVWPLYWSWEAWS